MTEAREIRNEGQACPLCFDASTVFAVVSGRHYFRCPRCALVFLDPARRPTEEEERTRYIRHRNSPDDPGYVAFVTQLATAVQRVVKPGARGIDYGCGPVPVLSRLLTQAGFPTAHYDPLFFRDTSVLQQRYDFVTCCEVAEHAFSPRQLFERMRDLVNETGIIAVMTRLYDDVSDFANWWYARDITHVSFYSAATLEGIAKTFGWKLDRPASNIALFSVR